MALLALTAHSVAPAHASGGLRRGTEACFASCWPKCPSTGRRRSRVRTAGCVRMRWRRGCARQALGAISQAHGKVAAALKAPVAAARDTLDQAPVVHMDETRYPRAGTANWVWGGRFSPSWPYSRCCPLGPVTSSTTSGSVTTRAALLTVTPRQERVRQKASKRNMRKRGPFGIELQAQGRPLGAAGGTGWDRFLARCSRRPSAAHAPRFHDAGQRPGARSTSTSRSRPTAGPISLRVRPVSGVVLRVFGRTPLTVKS